MGVEPIFWMSTENRFDPFNNFQRRNFADDKDINVSAEGRFARYASVEGSATLDPSPEGWTGGGTT